MTHKSAELSEDGLYRFRLSRWWGDGKRVVWCLTNPSNADALLDDPSVRKMMGFARAWGYDGIDVVNRHPLRSSDPKVLLSPTVVSVPENAKHIAAAVADTDLVICAWGCEEVWKQLREKRGWYASEVIRLIRSAATLAQIMCLGKSKNGTPYHPARLAYSTERQPFA